MWALWDSGDIIAYYDDEELAETDAQILRDSLEEERWKKRVVVSKVRPRTESLYARREV